MHAQYLHPIHFLLISNTPTMGYILCQSIHSSRLLRHPRTICQCRLYNHYGIPQTNKTLIGYIYLLQCANRAILRLFFACCNFCILLSVIDQLPVIYQLHINRPLLHQITNVPTTININFYWKDSLMA